MSFYFFIGFSGEETNQVIALVQVEGDNLPGPQIFSYA